MKKKLIIHPQLFGRIPVDGRVFLEAVGIVRVTEYRVCGVNAPKSTVVRIGNEHILISIAQEQPSVTFFLEETRPAPTINGCHIKKTYQIVHQFIKRLSGDTAGERDGIAVLSNLPQQGQVVT